MPRLAVLLLLFVGAASAGEIVPDKWLVIGPLDQRGRMPFRSDAVSERYLLDPGSSSADDGAERRSAPRSLHRRHWDQFIGTPGMAAAIRGRSSPAGPRREWFTTLLSRVGSGLISTVSRPARRAKRTGSAM